METSQNIQERIDELFNGNSKIPFMQSKDILRLGYIYGDTDARQSISENKVKQPQIKQTPKEQEYCFVGTTKDIIAHADKKIKENLAVNKEELKRTLEKKIKETKIQLLGEIIMYMKDNSHDYIDVFHYLNKMVDELQTNGTNNLI